MNKFEWNEFDDVSEFTNTDKVNEKKRKRKWQEIENIKEEKRLRKEMRAYDEYTD